MQSKEIVKKRFYHRYVDSFIHFIVPEGKKVLTITDASFDVGKTQGEYDYIVLSDILGHVPDVENFLRAALPHVKKDGRVFINQYSALWEPVLWLASKLRLRIPSTEENWLSPYDLENFLNLAGFEVVKSGAKMLVPIYIPLISAFFNTIVANIYPFSKLGLIHYVIARRIPSPHSASYNPSLSIVVPARNEAGTIEKIATELPALGAFTEVIFIEGNSKDNTYEEIKRVVAKYSGEHAMQGKRLSYAQQTGKGKGDAVRKGFDMATGDILLIYDADMTVPASEVIKFYHAIVEGKGEFINGSRLVYPMEKQSMRLINFFGNKFFSLAFSSILGQHLKDTLCGTKVLSREDYEDVKRNRAFFGDFDPFGDFDLLFGAAKLNRKIVDVPVHYKDRVYGSTNISRWKHGWLLLQMTAFAAKKLKFL